MKAYTSLFARTAPTLLALSLASSGCKRSPPAFSPTIAAADIKASCNARPFLSQCTDYPAAALDNEKFARSPCDVMHGVFAKSPCPGDRLVGSCEFGGNQVRRFYGDGTNQYDLTRAKRECEVGQGGWYAP